MKHELLLNGRDTTIDASFFIDNLNANPETIETDEYGHISVIEFDWGGERYIAWWRKSETVLRISPIGKGGLKKFPHYSANLLKMGSALKRIDLDGLGVKVSIGLDEFFDFKPELRISFYEEV